MKCRECQLKEACFKFDLSIPEGEIFDGGEFQLGTKIRWKLEVIGHGPKVIIYLSQITVYCFTCQYLIRLIHNGSKNETFTMGIRNILGSDPNAHIDTLIDLPASRIIAPSGVILSNKRAPKNKTVHTLHCYLKACNFLTACPKPFIKFTTDFANMLEAGQFTDFTILTDANQKIAVHKNVLGARSSVFRAMFECPMKESSTGEIAIKDFSEEVIKRMLIYIYSGKTEFDSVEKTIELLKIADKYDLPDLSESCSYFLANNLEASTCLEVLKLASKLSIEKLKDNTAKFISNNLDQIDKAETQKLESELLTSVLYNRVE